MLVKVKVKLVNATHALSERGDKSEIIKEKKKDVFKYYSINVQIFLIQTQAGTLSIAFVVTIIKKEKNLNHTGLYS